MFPHIRKITPNKDAGAEAPAEHMSEKIKLSRECDAMLIPSGMRVKLAAGNEVEVTHRLGGNLTVRGVFGMARIEEKDADALSEAAPETQKEAAASEENAAPSDAIPELREEDLWEVAKTVYDPELPVNIVDLGLIYRLEIKKDSDGKNNVEADMTLTAPGCAMGPMIADDLRLRMEALPAVGKASVNIVWDPPWNQDMMSEEARMILGLA